MAKTCPVCGGNGYIEGINGYEDCYNCNGMGVIQKPTPKKHRGSEENNNTSKKSS